MRMPMQPASTAAAAATEPARNAVLACSQDGFHRLSYTEWGDPHAPHVVVCVHGLTRNARDFDVLARALAPRCRVLCPDVAGRGRSDWLARAESYCYSQYLADMTVLLARATEHLPPGGRVDWVGSSMGGLIGILAASQPKHPIGRLVLNDIGPFVPRAAQERIARYIGQAPRFRTLDEAVQYVRTVSAAAGPLTDAQWHHLTVHSVRQDDDAQWSMRYDPAIAHAFVATSLADVSLWELWDRIDCPVFALRGMQSDVLLAETAERMTRTGPRAQLIEFAGIGHAPALLSADQVLPICAFLGLEPQAGTVRL
jgi:pimeloyl-ACP methyl ester carboxylesterase